MVMTLAEVGLGLVIFWAIAEIVIYIFDDED